MIDTGWEGMLLEGGGGLFEKLLIQIRVIKL